MPYESIPPMVIIAVGVGAMGALQGGVSYLEQGWKSKRTGMDMFDYQLEKRDRQLLEAKHLCETHGVRAASPIEYWKGCHASGGKH